MIVFSLNSLIGIGNVIAADIKVITFSDSYLPVLMPLLNFPFMRDSEFGHVTYLANGISVNVMQAGA